MLNAKSSMLALVYSLSPSLQAVLHAAATEFQPHVLERLASALESASVSSSGSTAAAASAVPAGPHLTPPNPTMSHIGSGGGPAHQ